MCVVTCWLQSERSSTDASVTRPPSPPAPSRPPCPSRPAYTSRYADRGPSRLVPHTRPRPRHVPCHQLSHHVRLLPPHVPFISPITSLPPSSPPPRRPARARPRVDRPATAHAATLAQRRAACTASRRRRQRPIHEGVVCVAPAALICVAPAAVAGSAQTSQQLSSIALPLATPLPLLTCRRLAAPSGRSRTAPHVRRRALPHMRRTDARPARCPRAAPASRLGSAYPHLGSAYSRLGSAYSQLRRRCGAPDARAHACQGARGRGGAGFLCLCGVGEGEAPLELARLVRRRHLVLRQHQRRPPHRRPQHLPRPAAACHSLALSESLAACDSLALPAPPSDARPWRRLRGWASRPTRRVSAVLRRSQLPHRQPAHRAASPLSRRRVCAASPRAVARARPARRRARDTRGAKDAASSGLRQICGREWDVPYAGTCLAEGRDLEGHNLGRDMCRGMAYGGRDTPGR